MKPGAPFNPFPGLRPFEADEDHLYFGCEEQTDDLLRRLRTKRFLVITGSSGSGKSSLVRCGLVPSVYSGMMAGAGSGWRVAIFRPGEDPIGHLAAALSNPTALGRESDDVVPDRVVLEVTLRRSTSGIVDAVRQSSTLGGDNVLIIVDQFEELFRFRNSRSVHNPKDEAAAFVKLLLEAVQQEEPLIYVVLTMRADFMGECMTFAKLPEAMNDAQYLVPRMTRERLRLAITGPVVVRGASIAPRLVARLLNDCGDDPDQLPVLQHALMRTWNYWAEHSIEGEPIDIVHYQAIGTVRDALSRHCEEAYAEAVSRDFAQLSERIFKALTDTSADAKGVRRPTSIEDLAGICGTTSDRVASTVEVFRREGRSFLTLSSDNPAEPRSVVDVSHESLMRCWNRLVSWATEERRSAAYYRLLCQAARSHEAGTVGLWRNPELEFGLRWRDANQPTAAWGERIDSDFEKAMLFLDRSKAERDREARERQRQRRLRWTLVWSTIGILSVLLAGAFYEWRQARSNLNLAKETVDSLLSSSMTQSSQMASESPDVEQFRNQLVQQAKATYGKIIARTRGQEFSDQAALVDLRLADGYRITNQTDQAIASYKSAIEQLTGLLESSPRNAKYRQELGDAYNWLGEAERAVESRRSEAGKAYDSALRVQEALHAEFPKTPDYQLSLARTYYNRGILRKETGLQQSAEADYRKAIALLTPLAKGEFLPANESTDRYEHELARAENNLAELIYESNLPNNARPLFEQAISIGERLLEKNPGNRDYRFELAQYYNNFANYLVSRSEENLALSNNARAIQLHRELARPLPTWMMHLGLSYDIRGRILETKHSSEAEGEYRRSIEAFEQIPVKAQGNTYRVWFGQALANLGSLLEEKKEYRSAIPLLEQAADLHQKSPSKYDLAWDYYLLATAYQASGSAANARKAIQQLSHTIPDIAKPDQPALEEALAKLRQHTK